VTGAAGFVGSWLVPELRSAGHPVVGVRKPGTEVPELDLTWVDADLRAAGALDDTLRTAHPSWIVHLAALALPREAERDPGEARRMNEDAVDHLLSSIRAHSPHTRLLFVSSGEVYARRSLDAAPAREHDPIAPPNAYARTKAAGERRVSEAVRATGLDAVIARAFNHSGPGRPSDYAESAFARQVAELERSCDEDTVHVGNLNAVRDFSDVRDVVRAYRILLEHGERGAVYNVCSGRPRTLRSVLDHLLGRARRELRIAVDEARFEAIDPNAIGSFGDPSRMRALGWTPRYEFEDTLDALLDDWRARV